jgi:hypothetical protein
VSLLSSLPSLTEAGARLVPVNCAGCGKPLPDPSRKHCSNACRQAAYRRRREACGRRGTWADEGLDKLIGKLMSGGEQAA